MRSFEDIHVWKDVFVRPYPPQPLMIEPRIDAGSLVNVKPSEVFVKNPRVKRAEISSEPIGFSPPRSDLRSIRKKIHRRAFHCNVSNDKSFFIGKIPRIGHANPYTETSVLIVIHYRCISQGAVQVESEKSIIDGTLTADQLKGMKTGIIQVENLEGSDHRANGVLLFDLKSTRRTQIRRRVIDRRFEKVQNLHYEGTARGLVEVVDRGDFESPLACLLVIQINQGSQAAVGIDLEFEVCPSLIGVQLVANARMRFASISTELADVTANRRILIHPKIRSVKIKERSLFDVRNVNREGTLGIGFHLIEHAYPDQVTGVGLVIKNRSRTQGAVQVQSKERIGRRSIPIVQEIT